MHPGLCVVYVLFAWMGTAPWSDLVSVDAVLVRLCVLFPSRLPALPRRMDWIGCTPAPRQEWLPLPADANSRVGMRCNATQVPELVVSEEVEKAVLSVVGVMGVHDFHVWSVSSHAAVASLHITVADGTRLGPLMDEVKNMLHQHGVHSSTVQVELLSHKSFDASQGTYHCLDPICSEDIMLNRLCCVHSSSVRHGHGVRHSRSAP